MSRFLQKINKNCRLWSLEDAKSPFGSRGRSTVFLQLFVDFYRVTIVYFKVVRPLKFKKKDKNS